ncbi:MAG: tRNA (cytidine(34)-2'-O)-methyltransferase [Verrucomicrobia bacterium]|nr:tRNA (cytidine(34)-2'-O)-methyltransferase [Verrucomicrobiota bacterium]
MNGTEGHVRRVDLGLPWPDPPLRVVLVQPEIAPNTGAIARLCAATGSPLHLVEPLGFRLTDRALKRAGLDYWDAVEMHRHPGWADWLAQSPPRFHLFSTAGTRSHYEADYRPGDALVFGSETSGLPQEILSRWPERVFGIPMRIDHVRSLNLATAVGIVLYEALRHTGLAPEVEEG